MWSSNLCLLKRLDSLDKTLETAFANLEAHLPRCCQMPSAFCARCLHPPEAPKPHVTCKIVSNNLWNDMDVSENSGTPKSSILIGFSTINHPFWGTPYFWKHPYANVIRTLREWLWIEPINGICGYSHLISGILKDCQSMLRQRPRGVGQVGSTGTKLSIGPDSSACHGLIWCNIYRWWLLKDSVRLKLLPRCQIPCWVWERVWKANQNASQWQ